MLKLVCQRSRHSIIYFWWILKTVYGFCVCNVYEGKIHSLKGIVHFEIKIWYLSAYLQGIQDVGVFFSSVDPILMFLGQTVLVCQS